MTAHEPDRLTQALHQKRRDIDDLDIAAAIGGDRTAVSRVFSDQYGIRLSKLAAFLDLMGYRVVPKATGIREVPEAHYQSLVVMAEIGTSSLQNSETHTRYSRPLNRLWSPS